MNARFRAVFQMGKSVLQISRDRPDPSAGYVAALARLADHWITEKRSRSQQMDGLRDVSAATERKKEVRRTLAARPPGPHRRGRQVGLTRRP